MIRLLIFAIIGYFLYRVVKRFITPAKPNPHVRGDSGKKTDLKKRNDIQDIDYEDVE